jgi:hypothetical protein
MKKYTDKQHQYYEKLKDPRWQKKRLEILERDDWVCQRCMDDESTLAVHHLYYILDRDPWDYPNDVLITLCEECHEYERENDESDLIKILKVRHFLSDDRKDLAKAFYALHLGRPPAVITSIIVWILENEQLMQELDDRYFDYLRQQVEKPDASPKP